MRNNTNEEKIVHLSIGFTSRGEYVPKTPKLLRIAEEKSELLRMNKNPHPKIYRLSNIIWRYSSVIQHFSVLSVSNPGVCLEFTVFRVQIRTFSLHILQL